MNRLLHSLSALYALYERSGPHSFLVNLRLGITMLFFLFFLYSTSSFSLLYSLLWCFFYFLLFSMLLFYLSFPWLTTKYHFQVYGVEREYVEQNASKVIGTIPNYSELFFLKSITNKKYCFELTEQNSNNKICMRLKDHKNSMCVCVCKCVRERERGKTETLQRITLSFARTTNIIMRL